MVLLSVKIMKLFSQFEVADVDKICDKKEQSTYDDFYRIIKINFNKLCFGLVTKA